MFFSMNLGYANTDDALGENETTQSKVVLLGDLIKCFQLLL